MPPLIDDCYGLGFTAILTLGDDELTLEGDTLTGEVLYCACDVEYGDPLPQGIPSRPWKIPTPGLLIPAEACRKAPSEIDCIPGLDGTLLTQQVQPPATSLPDFSEEFETALED